MKNAISFKPDEKTAKILSTADNKSEMIRKALRFYDECYDAEIWELINRLQERSNLRSKKAVLVMALRLFEEVLNFEWGGKK